MSRFLMKIMEGWIGLCVGFLSMAIAPVSAEVNPRDARFEVLDRNHDGVLTEVEAGIEGQQKMRLLWHSQDRDDDGRLDAVEYRAFEELADDYTTPPPPVLSSALLRP